MINESIQNIFNNIMQDSVLNKIIQSILHVLSFQAQCHWMVILKLHWNYTEMPLDWYTESTLKLHCTSSAPQVHLQRTPTAPQLHLQRTPTAPPLHLQRTQLHLQCTSTAPPAHLQQCTSSAPQTAHPLAPQPHLHICTRTSSAPQLHLPAPQLHLPAPQPLQIHV